MNTRDTNIDKFMTKQNNNGNEINTKIDQAEQ